MTAKVGIWHVVFFPSKMFHVFLFMPYDSPLLTESSALSNTSFPNIIPVLSLLERGVALGEALEPWESAEVGVDVVMYHLEAARTIAHHGAIYRTNAEAKLQGEAKYRNVSHHIPFVFLL